MGKLFGAIVRYLLKHPEVAQAGAAFVKDVIVAHQADAGKP